MNTVATGIRGVLLLGALLLGAWVVGPAAAAEASVEASVGTATARSITELNSVTIIQTSILAGLGPGVPPAAITGLIINNGPDDTFITAIDVSITSVTQAPGAAAGVCLPSDYVLLNPRMPVGQALAANGGSTSFAGASIGFNNKTTNQDACKNATVSLRYTTVPAAPPNPNPSSDALPSTGLTVGVELLSVIGMALLVFGLIAVGLSRRRPDRTNRTNR